MWLLTIVLLLSTGTDKVVVVPMQDETACYVYKERAASMNEYGLHVKAASCAEGGKQT